MKEIFGMETPKNSQIQTRSVRNHTPRLSERKKKLFGTIKDSECSDYEEEMLKGIEPLNARKSKNGKTPDSCETPTRVMSFFETESEDSEIVEELKSSTSRRSIRLSLKKSPSSSKSEAELSTSPHKENIPIKTPTRKELQEAKQLQKLFSNSMQITPRDKSMVIEETSSEDEYISERRKCLKKYVNKRHFENEESTGLSPSRKVAKTTTPIEAVSISTKSFYSGNNKVSPSNLTGRASCRNLFGQSDNGGNTPHLKSKHPNRRSLNLQSTSINRGVHHKIRKRSHALGVGPKHYTPVNIDQILNNMRNDRLRKLIVAKREEKEQIEKVHNILRTASNPIAMAKPLSLISTQDDSNNNNISEDVHKLHKSSECSQSSHQADTEFSDIECEAAEIGEVSKSDLEETMMAMNEDVIPIINHQADDTLSIKSDDSNLPPNNIKKKFFKSGRTSATRKEVHITDNIKATVTANGKLTLVPEKKKVKKRIKIRNSVANEFSDEQATVDAILRNLDDTTFGDVILSKDDGDDQNVNGNGDNSELLDEIDQHLDLMSDDIVLQGNQDFEEFRKRLPYNTTDPEIIERQHLLLDFLISNNICTEENFAIFIADPDNHKDEAEKIVDDLVMIVTDSQNTDFRQRIPYNTTDPEVIEQQHSFLDFLLENNICTEENFDIFIANYNQRKSEADAILSQYVTAAVSGKHIENTPTVTSSIDANLLNNNLNLNLSQEEINLSLNANSSKPVNSYDNILMSEKCHPPVITNDATPNNILMSEPISKTPKPVITNDATLNNCISSNQAIDNSCQQKLFPLFYAGGCQPLSQPSTRRRHQRAWNGGYGSNQYQIDAGQKRFGAHQCKQCGLVYTVHEPEEEKLHRDFHASLHILRFNGWIDEDIVAIYPEWSPDGRILRLTESSPPKRRERLADILKIVDKELGFSSYIIPKTFVAYLAVKRRHIVGLCLVQPLDKANKYLCVNNVDCCTEEQFEAKCGISRIWVSPLHRRLHIGLKLIQAVQLNTIFGEEIPLDKIAFSAPTEMGKAFAQQITKTENFLVYQ